MGWEAYPAKLMFPKFAQDWDRLNAQFYDSHPLFDSRLIGPLLDGFAKGNELLCIHHMDGVISGALILQAKGMGLWSTFQPAQSQVSAILLGDACLLESLFASLPGFAWTIELNAIDPRYSPDLSRLKLPRMTSVHAHTIGIHPDLSFVDFWGKRSKNLKANVRRYCSRAEHECSHSTFAQFTAPGEILAGVKRYGELESTGWKSAAGTAVSSSNIQGTFYGEVLRRFATTCQAAIYELHVGNQLAASRLVISSEKMVVILKTAYDEALARFAPGQILLYCLIKRQMEQRSGKTIEFYTNATRGQTEWSSFGCSIYNIQVFKSDFFASAFSIFKIIRRNWHGNKYRRPAADSDVRTVRVCGDIESFSDEQYDLQEFSARDTIEGSIDWFRLLQQEIYPIDSGIRYYFVAEERRPRTILPLRLTTEGRIRTIESLSNYYTPLYAPLVSKNSDMVDLKKLLATATRDHGGAHVMRFAPMDPNSPAYCGLLDELRAIGWIPYRYFCFGNWFLTVENNWDGYLSKRSVNLRSSIKRRRRRFITEGGSLEIVTSPEGLERAIATFEEIYSASWKIPEPYPDFVPSLIRLLSENGMLRLGIARLHEKPIAAQLWIVGQGKASIYKVAYHEDFSSFSPGTVLTSHLMQYVIECDHVTEVDFLIGDDHYKRIWMSNRRERWGIVAYNPRTIIGFALFVKEVSWRLAKSLGKKVDILLPEHRQIGASLASPLNTLRPKPARNNPAQRKYVMNWSLHPIAQFADYSSQWDALVQSRPGTPFLESAFMQPAIDNFSSGKELLCLLHTDGILRAATILQPGRQRGIWQTFQPSQIPLGSWISDGKVDFSAACKQLMGQLPGWALNIGASQFDPRIQARPEDSPTVRSQDYIETAWVDIEGNFDSYWEARGKNLRQNTRKQRNKLQAEGNEIRMECVTAAEEVKKAIEDYGFLESAGWKATNGTAIHPDNAQGRFYRKMLENYCTLGRGRIYRYWFGEKIVSMDLCIHDQTAIVILKTAYDESYKTISPSTLMRHDEFQQLFAEKKFSRIEFYGKVMEWHTRWTTQNRIIFHATVYRWPWLKQLHACLSASSAAPPPDDQSALPPP